MESYSDQARRMPETWAGVLRAGVTRTGAAATDRPGSAICLGSGGSLTLARLAQQLWGGSGPGCVHSMTPFEFASRADAPDFVCLFSARGEHHDLRWCLADALRRGSRIMLVTATDRSSLLREAGGHAHRVASFTTPYRVPADGFLAVNSTVAMAAILASLADPQVIGQSGALSLVDRAVEEHREDRVPVGDWPSLPCLHIVANPWAMPAAMDLESRLAESGLGTCFVADPANFTHGRFMALETLPGSVLLSISTPESRGTIDRLSRIVPESIPHHSIRSPFPGLLGAIYCTIRSILILDDLGVRAGRDPANPPVPEWGRTVFETSLLP